MTFDMTFYDFILSEITQFHASYFLLTMYRNQHNLKERSEWLRHEHADLVYQYISKESTNK